VPGAAEPNPVLSFDLAKIETNARVLKASVPDHIACFGVTKGCGGAPEVAAAMLAGGVDGLADSRLPHLRALRAAFPRAPLMALRQPTGAEVRQMVSLEAPIIISDPEAAKVLSAAAVEAGKEQNVVLMVEVGEEREGFLPAGVPERAETIDRFPGLRFDGLAVNTGCRGGVAPHRRMMDLLDRLVGQLENLGLRPEVVSAGNSSCWRLMEAGALAKTANHLRIGEALLLGRETVGGETLAGFHADAVRVRTEILEAADKFGKHRLVAAIGCQDIGAGRLIPVEPGIVVDRLTSDHAVLETPSDFPAGVGDFLEFTPSYLAMQAMSVSPYVTKVFIGYNSRRFSERAPVFGKNI